MRRQGTEVAGHVAPGRRHNGGKACDESLGIEHNAACAIGPRALEVKLHFVARQNVQAVVGKRWAQDVAAQVLTALIVIAVHTGGGVQVEAPMLGAEAAFACRLGIGG